MILKKSLRSFIFIFVIILFFTIKTFVNNSIDDEYTSVSDISFNTDSDLLSVNDLNISLENTVISKDNNLNASMFDNCLYALLVDDTDNIVYVSKDVHKRMYPASMTKLMTASIICDKIEEGSLHFEDIVTINKHYDLTQEGVGPCELGIGSEITVKDLLYALMIQSNNYYALILAEHVGGSVEQFCDLMNEKAAQIGASNTHFTNPHGLDDPNHYTTAYDMYLIMKEAKSHEILNEIDGLESYTYEYLNSERNPVEATVVPTNLFLSGKISLPAKYEIKLWKTGTTDGAGYCLVMYLTRDDKEYIAVCSNADVRNDMYNSFVQMLCLVK